MMDPSGRHALMRRSMCAALWIVILIATATTVTTATTFSPGAAACPSAPLKTLSLNCSTHCNVHAPCLVFSSAEPSPCGFEDVSPASKCPTSPLTTTSSSSSEADGCVHQCFTPYKSPGVFKFYVTFNVTRRAKVIAPPMPAATQPMDATLDLTNDVPYETNEFVRRISALQLPATVTQVVLAGGRTGDASTRGKVVDLEIDADVFAMAPQVTAITLRNMDLATRRPDIAAILSLNTYALDLSNTKLTQVPSSLGLLTQLNSLILERNFISTFPVDLKLEKLTDLRLRENELTAFKTTNLPALQFLDLSSNQLSSFPYQALLDFTGLQTLRVDSNPSLKGVVFSSDHFAKIAQLTEFTIDSSALNNSSCPSSQLNPLPRSATQFVCVVSVVEWTARQQNKNKIDPSPAPAPSPDNEPSSSSSSKKMVIIITTIIGVVVCVVLVGICIRRVCRKRAATSSNKTTDTQTTPSHMIAGDSSTAEDTDTYGNMVDSASTRRSNHYHVLTRPPTSQVVYSLRTDSDLLAQRLRVEEIEDQHVIGSGGFAVVWLVKYRPQHSHLLASKRLIRDQITRQKTMQFVTEIKLNMQLVHPSIVPFVGVAWTVETDLQALFEYMSHGDLRSFLETTSGSDQDTSWTQEKLQIAIDIVEALVYVHSFSPPLVHRDLKSRNVLLAQDMKAKLSDFGVSRFQSQSDTMTAGVGTGKWLAPEVIAGSKSYDASCDIYSFGVLLSELDTHELPYEKLRDAKGAKLPEFVVLQRVALGQLTPPLSEKCPSVIRDLAQRCLAFEPSTRPTATEVVHSLRALYEWKYYKE